MKLKVDVQCRLTLQVDVPRIKLADYPDLQGYCERLHLQILCRTKYPEKLKLLSYKQLRFPMPPAHCRIPHKQLVVYLVILFASLHL